MQDLKRQLEACEQLRSFLQRFISDLAEMSAEYNRAIDALVDDGLPVQISQNYKNSYQQRNTAAINNIMQIIETEDIPYVNRNIEALQDVIDRASAK